ncbi:hypothetical protein ON010_g2886 [Phytophthora cinnamomi]|nr:hypothetical protein ON010_g2886 [Phytophthora cinnamomi]
MDFFNKAKQAAEKYAGGDSSSSSNNKKSDSIFSKAKDAAEKYHAKDKAVEFAQKRVAKREDAKHEPGYVEKKDKSTVDKAVEAAEDFPGQAGTASGQVSPLRRQEGQPDGRHPGQSQRRSRQVRQEALG